MKPYFELAEVPEAGGGPGESGAILPPSREGTVGTESPWVQAVSLEPERGPHCLSQLSLLVPRKQRWDCCMI